MTISDSVKLSVPFEFLTDTAIYNRVVQSAIPCAEKFVWIATSDLKDMYVNEGRRMVPFLKVLSQLIDEGVSIRLLHAKEPGPNFRKDFDRYPNLVDGLEQILCPRVHFKAVIIDGTKAYMGSANVTGAGMGAKGENTRNFESGLFTENQTLVQQIMEQFDAIWMGTFCGKCRRKQYCAEYKDLAWFTHPVNLL